MCLPCSFSTESFLEAAFAQTLYNISESDGYVEVCIVLRGLIARDIKLGLLSLDETADCKLLNYYCHSNL